MLLAEIQDNRIVIEVEYRDRYAVKTIPGGKWLQANTWSFPISWASCVSLRGTFGNRLEIGPVLGKWAWDEKQTRIDPCNKLRDATDGDFETDVPLYPPQKAGIAWLRATKRGLLGDPMGTGKTRQLLMAIPEDGWPALVITPNSVRGDWNREAKKVELDADVRVLNGSTAQRLKQLEGINDGDKVLVIMNWESVRMLSRLAPYGSIALRRCIEHGGIDPKITAAKCEAHPKALNNITWRTVIRDEAHKAKDPKSKQTRATWSLQHADTVRYCWDATGTPIAQHLGDLWSIMHGNSPEDFPRKSAFVERYALATWNSWGGLDIGGINPQHQEEFFSFFDPRFRRVPKEVLLPFLPPKVPMNWYVDMDKKQRDAYNDMANNMIAELESGVVVTTNALAQYVRMSQFSAAYARIDDDGHVHLETPSCKVNAMMEILDSLEGESIVFSMISAELLDLCADKLRAEGISFTWIRGGMSMEQQEQAKEDFQSGKVRVILLMAQAGGVGITLTKAPYLARLQRSWSQIENLQIEDRVHRIGSEMHTQVTIIDVYTRETFEMGRQLERLQEKGVNLAEILRDKETLKRIVFGNEVAA